MSYIEQKAQELLAEIYIERDWPDIQKYREHRMFPPFEALCRAMDRITALETENQRLREALQDLLEDTQHKDHDCGDEEWCPVIKARAALGKAEQ
jgi:hypothetical protein